MDNLVAKRHYRRVLPPYAVGAFVNVPGKSSPNVKQFYDTIFPLPSPLSWTEKVAVWIAPEDGHYVDKTIPHPAFFYKVNFTLNQKQTTKCHGENVEYEYRLIEATPDKTVLRIDVTSTKGKLVNEMIFTHEGFTYTTKKEGGEQVSGEFKRVLPWLFYGKYEDVPEKAENWDEFTKGHDAWKTVPKFTEIYQKGEEYHLLKHGGESGKNVDLTFKLNTPTEKTAPNGKTVKYTVTVDGVADKVFLRTDAEIVGTDEKFTIATFATPCGIVSKYFREGIVAKRYYRRIVSPAVFGSFESSGEVTEEFKTFANTIRAPEFLKKITMEFSKADDGKLTQKMTEEGDPTVHETTFTLGKPNTLEAHGHTVNYTTYYMELEGKPVIVSFISEPGKPERGFRVTAMITPEGYDAYYVYGGDVRYGGEKLVTRKFTRKGAPVPVEQH